MRQDFSQTLLSISTVLTNQNRTTNSGYSRWWEGRQLWGKMINSSRHFGLQVNSYL
ncbi:MAG: bestrophin family ion channel, partial [Fervidobacterium pennivorans]